MNGAYLALASVGAGVLLCERCRPKRRGSRLNFDYAEIRPSINPPSGRSAEVNYDYKFPEMWGTIYATVDNVPRTWSKEKLLSWLELQLKMEFDDGGMSDYIEETNFDGSSTRYLSDQVGYEDLEIDSDTFSMGD